MLSATIGNNSHTAQDELAEQILAVTKALEVLRQRYEKKVQEEEEQRQAALNPPPPTKSNSTWGSLSSNTNVNSFSKSSHVRHTTDIYVLPPNEHPIVLGIWATCGGTESTLRNALGRTLQELLVERRKHLRELELTKEQQLRSPSRRVDESTA
ncbi:hypothetical protein BGX34_009476 [Mortierella sp. NVP85]|nr:hypothetical protein BGX34_009476 [Mortierella sp. NVP85]